MSATKPPEPDADQRRDFAHVLRAELAEVAGRRSRTDPPAPAPPPAPPAEPLKAAWLSALDLETTGLAFSGGGIRSATFNLGVLQGLAGLGLLRRFDYLSTVSGGGYIGGWLAAWVKREGALDTVEKQLAPERAAQAKGRPQEAFSEDEPEPVFHLRAYSNYLTPRTGPLSADTWVGVATYLRNFLLNQMLLLPAIVAAQLLTRLLFLFYFWDGHPAPLGTAVAIGVVAFVTLLTADANIWTALARLSAARRGEPPPGSLGTRTRTFLTGIVLPVVGVAVLACWYYDRQFDPYAWEWLSDATREGFKAQVDSPALRGAIAAGLFLGVVLTLLHGLPAAAAQWRSRRVSGLPAWWAFAAAGAGAASGAAIGGLSGAIIVALREKLRDATLADQAYEAAVVLTLGPPAIVAMFALSAFVQVGVLGRSLSDNVREWWSSLCGRLLLIAGAWAVVFGVSFFSKPFLIWAGPAVNAALGAGWLATAAGGVLAARSPATGTGGGRLLDRLVRLAPLAVLVGLLVGVSVLVSAAVDDPPPADLIAARVPPRQTPPAPPVRVTVAVGRGGPADRTIEYTESPDETEAARRRYWAGLVFRGLPKAAPDAAAVVHSRFEGDPTAGGVAADMARTKGPRMLGLLARHAVGLAVVGVVLLLANWRLDINTFSMHGTYLNRLVRCYLGASRAKTDEKGDDRRPGAPANSAGPPRAPDPITGFDDLDDFRLHDLRTGAKPADRTAADAAYLQQPYWGPIPIVNTALNLVQGDELAWQERMAESFVMTPLFCGSKTTGYRPQPQYAGGVSLGTAVTVSGAAASPNMGYHSSPAVTALLTVFNVRLGAWLGNPRRDAWRSARPRWSLLHLFKELFGRTNRRYDYVYLSDGGHFENLGVYELVRRRCRLIVVCDAGADGDYSFDDLGGLMRKCRSDLGVPIEIDTTPVRPDPTTGRSQWHCAVGKVRYDAVQPEALPGMLVYIKSSLTGNEPSDVLNYAARNATFPHQSTGDQFFSESQFESYRALGYHIARDVFGDAMAEVPVTAEMTDDAHRKVVWPLMSALQRRWFPPPPRIEERYVEAMRACMDLDESFRTDPNLQGFNLGVYPELTATGAAPAVGGGAARGDAELLAANQMLQVMEGAWMAVRLEGFHAHPLNRGWMNVMRRWASSGVFRRYWLVLRGEYSSDFVRFCEKELGLDRGAVAAVRCDPDDLAFVQPEMWRTIKREFCQDWPLESKTLVHKVRLDACLEDAARLTDAAGRPAIWMFQLTSGMGTTDLVTPPDADAANGEDAGRAATDAATLPTRNSPVGFALVHRPQAGVERYELVVWLRGGYRNLGIGTKAVHHVIADLERQFEPPPGRERDREFSVRLPMGARTGVVARMQRDLWLRFYSQFNFRRRPDAPDTDTDLVLYRTL